MQRNSTNNKSKTPMKKKTKNRLDTSDLLIENAHVVIDWVWLRILFGRQKTSRPATPRMETRLRPTIIVGRAMTEERGRYT